MGAVRSKNQTANRERLTGLTANGKHASQEEPLRCALAVSPFVATPNHVWSTEGEGLDNLNIVRSASRTAAYLQIAEPTQLQGSKLRTSLLSDGVLRYALDMFFLT